MSRWCRSAAVLAVIVAALIAPALAVGESFYWYGESPDCWQTGQPGASQKACDYPGGSTINNVEKELGAAASGDYCVRYAGGAHGEACEDHDSSWPLTVRAKGTIAGAQHYVSFASQQDLPWSAAFAEPALEISAELAVEEAKKPSEAWAYLCPIVKAPEQPFYIQLCFVEWQGKQSQGDLHNEAPPYVSNGFGFVAECSSPEIEPGHKVNLSLADTPFAPSTSTPFGTTLSGSQSTEVEVEKTSAKFVAEITLTDLRQAIERVKAPGNETGRPGKGEGCGKGFETLSTNLAAYQLVGIEDGIEGYPSTKLKVTASNLQARTEYTPPSGAGTPFAFRDPSTGNQYVFFRGAENALWEEEWTASGGWSLNRIGGQLTSDPMGYIEPNKTINIFYRGGNDAIWQYYRASTGLWTTQELGGSSAGKPYGYLEPNGSQNIFYRGGNNEIWQLYNEPGGSWHNIPLGGARAEGDPTAYLQPDGEQNVFYLTTEHTIGQLWWVAESGWHNNPIGGSASSNPTALLESNGNQNVFFRTPENTIGQLWWSASTGWHSSPLGGSAIGNPFAFTSPNEQQHVYYRNGAGEIVEWLYEPSSGWHNIVLGGDSAADATGFSQPNGDLNVYFTQVGNGALDQWFYNGTWNESTLCCG
jgi:hypothetical protein